MKARTKNDSDFRIETIFQFYIIHVSIRIQLWSLRLHCDFSACAEAQRYADGETDYDYSLHLYMNPLDWFIRQ
jgi:hypothetical protein